MRALRLILVVAACGVFSTAIAARSGGITVLHHEPLQRLSIKGAGATVGENYQNSGPTDLSFDALGKTFNFRLEPNRRILSSTSRRDMSNEIGIYRGRLTDNPNSWARIVIYKGIPRGLFWDGQQMYAIEAPGDSVVKSDSPVIFRLADTFIDAGTMTCGTKSLSGNGAVIYQKLVGEVSASVAQAPGAVSEIDIGAVGDFEFTSAQGGDVDAVAAISARLNMVDGIYSQEIGVQINVPLIETFSDSADPFSDESDPGLLLDELVSYRQSTPAQRSLGLTHLYTGRSLDGSTVGIAYSDVLCRTNVGAGLSEGNGTATFDSLVAAHEIGHNFGAPHDGVIGGVCEAEPLDFIMAPSVNINNNQFSQCSIAIMKANAAQASCVGALPTVDMSVVLSGQPAVALLSSSPELTIDLSNNGATEATNVVADIVLPSNVSFVSATASSGTCNNGGGIVSCQIGNVPGLTGRTVTLTTTASSVGVGMFDVSVSSDFDERPGNNNDSVQLTVDPAVDLVVNAPTDRTINLEQSATVNASIDNLSPLAATGVSMSITLDTGLRADSVSWSIGTCTLTDRQIDCQASNIAGQSSSSFSMGITGITAGSRRYTVRLSSNEADADTTNNDVAGTVTVNDPDDDSGGGAIGVPFLMLLGMLAVTARRRSRLTLRSS